MAYTVGKYIKGGALGLSRGWLAHPLLPLKMKDKSKYLCDGNVCSNSPNIIRHVDRPSKNLKIIIEPQYIDGKPTVVLLEGTFCTNCNDFLAPPEATDDQRIQAAYDHVCKKG